MVCHNNFLTSLLILAFLGVGSVRAESTASATTVSASIASTTAANDDTSSEDSATAAALVATATQSQAKLSGFNVERFVASQHSVLTKIVKVLENLKVELDKEMKEEKVVYEKFMTWCNKDAVDKDAAICALRDQIK